MKSRAGQISEKVGICSLFGYFFSTTFSHALAQNFLGLALLCGLIIIFSEKKYKEKLKPGYFSILLILFIGWSIISAVFSGTPGNSLLILKEEWLFLMIPAAAFFIKDEKTVETALKIFAVSAIIMSLYAIWQHFTGIDLYRGGTLPEAPSFGYRVCGTFSHRLTFGNYFAIAAILFLGVAPHAKSVTDKSIFFSAFILSSLATVFTYSRGPIAILAISVAVLLIWLGKKYIKTIIPLVAGLIIIIVIFSPDILSRYYSSAEIEWKGEYAGSRLSIWRTAGRMAADNPIFGVGPGNFGREYSNYRDEKSDRVYSHAHNDLLNVSAYAGFPATLFFLGFWIALLKKILDFLRNKDVKSLRKGVAKGLFMASVVFFMTSLFEATFADEEIRLLLMALWGLFFALSKMVNHRTETAETIEKA